jgi:hypothetical protein
MGETEDPTITAVKSEAYVTVSNELLMEWGLIHDTRPPVKISWRERMCWRWMEWRKRVGRKIGGWIAGVDLSERDE